MALNGIIFDIQRFSTHDGPGIRTTLFLKGCPLNCLWCHNPESINREPELSYDKLKCIGCNSCVEVCTQEAIQNNSPGEKIYYSEKCNLCWECVQECPINALKIQGQEYTVEEAFKEIEEDKPFFQQSGGGVTLSGGEPTLQIEFCRELLKKCKEEGIDTALDTSGFVEWEKIKSILPYLDLILFDLKHMDSSRHEELTGVPNEVILENLKKLSHTDFPVEIRMPIIPGYNDAYENLESTASFINSLNNIKKVILLKYHKLGLSKPWQFNKSRGLSDLEPPSEKRMAEIVNIFEKNTEIEISYR